MSGKIIDAKRRFAGHGSNDPEATRDRIEKRRQDRVVDLSRLRITLKESKRMDPPDRRVIVRNSGA